MRRTTIATSVIIVFLVAPAHAATTVGSDLSRAPDTPGYCTADGPGDACTLVQITIGTADQAVPIDGVITRWALRDARGTLTLRVVDGPAGQRRVVASGPAVQATPSGVQSFPVQVPVRAGQRVGLEVSSDGGLPYSYRDEQTTADRYVPPLGETPAAPIPDAAPARTYELFYNFTVEADADRDGLGDESQDPDRGGRPAPPPAAPPQGAPGPQGDPQSGCPTAGIIARGAGSIVFRQGTQVFGCRAGRRTLLGTRGRTTSFRLYRFNGDKLALVRVKDGRSTVQGFDLGRVRRIFSSTRTSSGGRPSRWRVTDLVITPGGRAAWIAVRKGVPNRTTVWVRSGSRVQQIDQGRLRATSLTLSQGGNGINYKAADGGTRNSGF